MRKKPNQLKKDVRSALYRHRIEPDKKKEEKKRGRQKPDLDDRY